MERREQTVLTRDGLRLHVTQWGAETAPPVVMLHGIRGYAETFAGIAAALQPDCRVVAFDQRGRGRSDWDPQHNYYTDTYVDDVDSVADALGLGRFDLLGHSMGGINAIVYAARYPSRVNRLLIEDAGPGAFEASPGAVRICRELTNTPAHFASWEEARVFMRGLRPSVSEDAREQRLNSMLRADSGGGFTWQYDHVGIAATRLNPDPQRVVDLRLYVAQLTCDTLVVRGGASDYLQAQMVNEMQRLNPRIRSVVVPGAGHYIHDDQPALFHKLARAFLTLTR
ncbi:alpha/beta hydrolase [Hydrogenophaga sp. 5NK40-0174]|uniref:alpha/beta fold hydrolase n=1 Tax=Hydrogenophaga sp. 5NK40-0174 TaxID=3127649 RepID=UPI00310A45C4